MFYENQHFKNGGMEIIWQKSMYYYVIKCGHLLLKYLLKT